MAATPKQPIHSIASQKFIEQRARPGRSRAPLLGFKEACKEFGVSAATLRGMMVRHTPQAPAPEFAHAKGGCYYNAADFRAWFASAKAKQQEASRG